MARWLGNWLPWNVSRVQFLDGTTFCVNQKLLIWVWGLGVIRMYVNLYVFTRTHDTEENLRVGHRFKKNVPIVPNYLPIRPLDLSNRPGTINKSDKFYIIF